MKKSIKLSLFLAAVILATGCSFAPANQKSSDQNKGQERNQGQTQTQNQEMNQSENKEQNMGQNAQIANPASTNCIEKGGKLEMRTRENLGEYGVCYFEDNRQCEEWAMFRGECPVGGVKVTGYNSDAAAFCAITGGEYQILTGKLDGGQEQGKCKLKNGKECDVWEYYKGNCDQNSAKASEEKIAAAIYKCKDNKTIDATFFTDYADIKLSDSRNLKLNIATSASGARYANENETIVFWNKGNTAFMEESGKTTFEDCIETTK